MRSVKAAAVTLAALAMSAVAVVPSASATELCSTNTNPCSGTKYSSGTAFEAVLTEGTKATLATSSFTVVCAETTMKGKTSSSGGAEEAVKGTLTSLVFAKCETTEAASCTVEAANLPYDFEIGSGDSGNGVLFLSDATGVSTVVKCGFIACTYTAEEPDMRFELSGGNPASAKVEKAPFLKTAGALCPEKSTFTDSSKVAQPAPAFAVNLWMRADFEPFDFGKVKINTSKTQKITFRYVGAGQTRLLSAFVTNIGGEAAFSIAKDAKGNPEETCDNLLVSQGSTCYAVVKFEPKTTGKKEAKVSVDDKLGSRHFAMIVKGEGE